MTLGLLCHETDVEKNVFLRSRILRYHDYGLGLPDESIVLNADCWSLQQCFADFRLRPISGS